jgi:hypothetical protein
MIKEYYVNGTPYKVSSEDEEEFLKEHSNAKLKEENKKEYHVGPSGKKYTVKD